MHDGDINALDIADDLFDGVFACGVVLDDGDEFILAFEDFAEVVFAEEAVEVVEEGFGDVAFVE